MELKDHENEDRSGTYQYNWCLKWGQYYPENEPLIYGGLC